MKCIEPGHIYRIEVYDSTWQENHQITFMKRVGGNYPGNISAPHSGTNCQEVLRVLIDRFKYLNTQIPCQETEDCIELARTIIFRLEQRAKRVKGKELLVTKDCIENYTTCTVCGHILCTEDHNA